MSSIDQLRLSAPKKSGAAKTTTAPARKSNRDSDDLDVQSVAKSVVKIFCYSSSPDAGQPWQLSRGQLSTGSGWFIEYGGEKFIITNAHCVVNFTTVQVKRYGSPRKWPATVLFIADTCDLAVLSVEEKGFWTNTPALSLSSIPQLNSACYVVGYPTGGDELSYSKGVVSRIELQTYAHSSDSYLAIQIDAGINSGNSGGPVVAPTEDGGFVCIGVAFETLNGANSIGYVIAPPVVLNMLESFKTNNPGCPSLNLITQPIESHTMRKSLYIPTLPGLIDYLFDLQALSHSLIELAHEAGLEVEEEDVEAAAAEGEEKKDFTTGKVRSPTPSETEAAAQHWIIGRDDEYDYVVFKPQGDGDDDDDIDEDGEEDMEIDLNNIDLSQFSPNTQETLKAAVSDAMKNGTLAPEGTDLDLEEGAEIDEDDSNVLTLCDENTPIYRIKRTSDVRTAPPLELLPLLLSENGIYDTQIGISIRSIIPFTESADVFKEGDVILAIDNIPVSSDETILFRDSERVRFSYLTSNKLIGTKTTVLILRGFDILPIEIQIQPKQTVAKLFDYTTPQWLIAMGLVFAPLSGNLMQSEFGEEWTSESPISLLESLFLGSLRRFHHDEQIVVLTQILSHPSTEGYDMAMQRLTHVNGERIINMKHLATILHNAVSQYEKNREIAQQVTAADTHSPISKAGGAISDDVDIDEDMEPSQLHQLFAKQLQTMGRINYITFTLLSGQVITLSLADGHQKHLEILKLHQIPLPGCSESLMPMYSMEVKVELLGATGAEKASSDANVLLQPKQFKPVKSATNAQILSPTPLSPRNSHVIIPTEEKVYNSPFAPKKVEYVAPEPLFNFDTFNPTSPRDARDKFSKSLKQKKSAVKK